MQSKNKNSLTSLLKGILIPKQNIPKRYLSTLLKESTKFATGLMLDVGCGFKPYKKLFSQCVNIHLGFDMPTGKTVNISKKEVDFYASCKAIPLKDSTFDTVLCTQVLEHISEQDILFTEIYRVLKQKGILILTAPQAFGLHEVPNDYYRYTAYGLEYLLKKHNFSIIYIKQSCGTWAMVGDSIIRLFRQSKINRILILKLFLVFFYASLQLFFIFLDTIFKNRGDTLDNIAIARKYQ